MLWPHVYKLHMVVIFGVFGGWKFCAQNFHPQKFMASGRTYAYSTGPWLTERGSSRPRYNEWVSIKCCHSRAGTTNPHRYWLLLLRKVQQNNSPLLRPLFVGVFEKRGHFSLECVCQNAAQNNQIGKGTLQVVLLHHN